MFVLVMAASFGALSVSHPVQVERGEMDGVPFTQVTNALVRYRFSDEGGVLTSAFLHYTTLRDRPLDAVPGWRNEDTFAAGASYPFELWVDGYETRDAAYEHALVQEDEERVVLELTGEDQEWSAAKRFTVDHDALYTMDVHIGIAAPGSTVQLVLGYLSPGTRLYYLYDGELHGERLEPGMYEAFEGMGLVKDRAIYFLKLDSAEGLEPFRGQNPAGEWVFGVQSEQAPDELTLQGTLYSGRDRYLLLEAVGLEELSPVGFFSQFLVYVMRFLNWLYELTGNYAWAILLFTLLTRVLLYPLMRTQLRSMAKMQRLQPKMKKLQEKYKDDRATLQKQMMEMYRKENVNPLGGCLPMLLQFPLLILLWQAIMYSSEQIRLSPGFLWITDLSARDPYYVLVIVTTGLMMLQQWLTQRRTAAAAPAGGMQAMGWLFPLIMAVLLLNWPAGLWMYWLFTTVFQIGQQMLVDREITREEAAASAARANGENEGS